MDGFSRLLDIVPLFLAVTGIIGMAVVLVNKWFDMANRRIDDLRADVGKRIDDLKLDMNSIRSDMNARFDRIEKCIISRQNKNDHG